MSSDINLIKQTSQVKRTIGKALVALYALFGLLFIVAAGLMLYNFTLQARLSALDKENQSLSTQINSFAARKENLLVIDERLSSIQTIITGRGDIDKKMNTTLSLISSDLSITSVTADKDLVTMRLSSPSLSSFNKLLEEDLPIFTGNAESEVKIVEVGSFSQSDTDYSMTLDFYFNELAKEK